MLNRICRSLSLFLFVFLAMIVNAEPARSETAAQLCKEAETRSYVEQIPLYRKAVALDPKYLPAQVWLGFALRNSGKEKEGNAVHDKVLKASPKTADDYYSLARVYSCRGDKRAQPTYTKVISLDPKLIEAYQMLAYSQKTPAEKLAVFDQCIKANPRSAQAYLNRANSYAYPSGKSGMDGYKKMLADATTAVQLDPELREAYWTKITYQGYFRESARSIADCTQLIKLCKKAEQEELSKGTSPSGTKGVSATVTRLRNEAGRAYATRARLLSSKQNKEALADFNTAFELGYKDYGGRSGCLSALGDYKAALADLDASIKDLKQQRFVRAPTYLCRAGLCEKLGDWQEAINCYTKALKQRPQSKDILNRRAAAYDKAGNRGAAQDDRATANAIKSEPDYCD